MSKGLQVFTSNRLETLVDELGRVCSIQLGSVFRPETVVVQSQGMARWLSLQLAERNGVCANYRFLFPNAFIHQVFKAVLTDLPREPECRLEVLVWRVMRHLPDRLGNDAFADLNDYLGKRDDSRKLFQLAQKIAWMFDQYLVFRPDFIERWEAGEELHWQAELWRIISADFTTPHRTALRREFFRKMRTGTVDLKRLPERFSIFGISALPLFHMEVFSALAEKIPINLFLLQPCREFWGCIANSREAERLLKKTPEQDEPSVHIESGNRLLASMGMLGRDFLNLILDFDTASAVEQFSEPNEQSLLSTIQSDILQLQDRGTAECGIAEVSPNDRSIEIHSCHSAMRELEVLQDCMLDWFQRDPKLQPRDILVLTPDLEIYAPFVEAVFGCPESPSHAIPFSIADKNPRKEGHVIETFITLLNVAESRLGVVQVLTLLECDAVRERFSISERDLLSLREWVDAAGIRWGIDAKHRSAFDVPAFEANSWTHGLEQLLLGYAMHNGDEQLFANRLPLDLAQGTAARTLGNFLEFTNKLFELVESLKAPRLFISWKTLLRDITHAFFELNDETEDELRMIWQAVEKIHDNADAAGFENPVPLAVILELLNAEFSEDARGVGFLDGGVTFASLKPMRSLPFKIICLVGMNDGAFPRHASQLGFDLMAKNPRLGDRSTRDDDRYLFLETIVSAREKLHISYQGQSIQDNSSRPPSVLISELTDYIAQGFRLPEGGNVVERITIKHRLQAFHPSYFSNGRLFSYSEENFAACAALGRARTGRRQFFDGPLPTADDSWRLVTVEHLTNFFCNPSEFIMRHRLGIRLPREEEQLEEREPFAIDGRVAYEIRQELVNKALAGISLEEAQKVIAATGALPVGEAGTVLYRGLSADVSTFLSQLQPFCPNQSDAPALVDYTIGDFRIVGQIGGLTKSSLLRFRCAKLKTTDILRLWIPHLVLSAAQNSARAVHVALDTTIAFGSVENAAAHLAELLRIYFEGLHLPTKFFPETSYAFSETRRRNNDGTSKMSPMTEAAKKWSDATVRDGSGFRTIPGEKANPYVTLCFGDDEPFDREFECVAQHVFDPILKTMETIA